MAIHPEKKKEPSQFSNGWIGRIQIRRNIQSHVCHGKKTGCLSIGAVVRIIAVQGAVMNFFT